MNTDDAEPRIVAGPEGARVLIHLGGDGSYLLLLEWDDGDRKYQTFHFSGLPAPLASQLNKCTEHGRRVTNAVWGPGGEWYVRDENGDGTAADERWAGFRDQSFDGYLSRTSRDEPAAVRWVSIGAGGGWVAVRSNHESGCANVSPDLRQRLSQSSAGEEAKPSHRVSLSQRNQHGYWISDGKGSQWCNLDPELNNQLKASTFPVLFVCDSPEGEWIIIRTDNFISSPGISEALTEELSYFYTQQQRFRVKRDAEIAGWRPSGAHARRQRQLQQDIQRKRQPKPSKRTAPAVPVGQRDTARGTTTGTKILTSQSPKRVTRYLEAARDAAAEHDFSEVIAKHDANLACFRRKLRITATVTVGIVVTVYYNSRTVGVSCDTSSEQHQQHKQHKQQRQQQQERRFHYQATVSPAELGEIFACPLHYCHYTPRSHAQSKKPSSFEVVKPKQASAREACIREGCDSWRKGSAHRHELSLSSSAYFNQPMYHRDPRPPLPVAFNEPVLWTATIDESTAISSHIASLSELHIVGLEQTNLWISRIAGANNKVSSRPCESSGGSGNRSDYKHVCRTLVLDDASGLGVVYKKTSTVVVGFRRDADAEPNSAAVVAAAAAAAADRSFAASAGTGVKAAAKETGGVAFSNRKKRSGNVRAAAAAGGGYQSPAGEGGVLIGDRITSIQVPLQSGRHLLQIATSVKGKPITVHLLRNGQRIQRSFQVGFDGLIGFVTTPRLPLRVIALSAEYGAGAAPREAAQEQHGTQQQSAAGMSSTHPATVTGRSAGKQGAGAKDAGVCAGDTILEITLPTASAKQVSDAHRPCPPSTPVMITLMRNPIYARAHGM
jgi:hypothetical protein